MNSSINRDVLPSSSGGRNLTTRSALACILLVATSACGNDLPNIPSSTGNPPSSSDGSVPTTSDGGTGGTGGTGTAPTPDDPTKNAQGMNAYATLDWARNRPFADLMKTARNFTAVGNDGVAVPVDANGWPTTDSQVIVFADLSRNHGTYALSFEGRADVTANGGTVSNVAYDAATNTTKATLTIASANTSFLQLVFRNTQGGVRKVRLMRPTTPGATTPYAANVLFTDQFLALMEPFSVVRVMDWLATNANGQVNWSDRVLPSYASGNRQVAGYGWQGRGTAWEYAIALANAAGKDLWIDVPGEATEDYIRRLATLFRDGSTIDGVRYEGLRSDLKVYVEYSNEMWNSAGGFDQTMRNHNAAIAEVAAGGSPLSFDGVTDPWVVTWRRIAYRAARISMIFREVFGDAAMMTRIRPVLEWQQNDGQATGSTELDFVDRYFGTVRTGVPVAHPVSWFFWGGGGSAYYGPDNGTSGLTLDNVWTSGTMAPNAWREVLRRDAMLTFAHGLRRVAYEGGPSMDGPASSAVKAAAWADPRMTDIIIANHDIWSQMGGDLLVYYCDAGPTYEWPFTYDALDLDTAKLRAVRALATRPRAAATIGRTLPTSYQGGEFDYSNPEWMKSSYGGQSSVRIDGAQNQWFLYVVRVTAPTTVDVTLQYGNGSAGAQAAFRLDGVSAAPVAVAGSGTTATTTFQLSPGVHGLVLRAAAGQFDVQRVNVTSR